MGRTHALSGVAAYLGIATVPGSPLLIDPGSGLLVGAVMAGGAAMMPDLDHPQASISRALGPLTGLVARAVASLAGGHRQGTHSLLGVGLATAVTVLMAQQPVVSAGWAAFLLVIAITAVGGDHRATRVAAVLGATVGGAALVGLALLAPPPVAMMIAAVGIGTATHIAGDMLTREGVPLLWPLRQRHRLARFTTGGALERWVIVPILTAVILGLGVIVTPGMADGLTDAAEQVAAALAQLVPLLR